MENILNYIRPELLILIPVLYFVGMGLKKSERVSDKYIPALLGVCGVVLSIIYVLASSDVSTWQNSLLALFVSITQGILCAGCSVYVNQIKKQSGKEE